MQPKLEKIFPGLSSSIAVKREIVPYMDYPLHYHPEFEIIFVEKSYGIRVMGNHIGNFRDGDLMFISPNLPHVWRNDKDFYKGDKSFFVDVYVIQFLKDAFGKEFFDLPEFAHIRKLFLLGQLGNVRQRQRPAGNCGTDQKSLLFFRDRKADPVLKDNRRIGQFKGIRTAFKPRLH